MLCLGLAAGETVLVTQWSEPASAKNGNSSGNGNSGGGNSGGNAGGGNGGNNGGGNAGSNAGGNGSAHGNPGGKGAPPAGPQAQPPAEEDTDIALGLRNAGRIKPLAEVYAAAERQFDGKVIDARLVRDQRGGWIYDVRLVTKDGHLRDVAYRATNLVLVSIDGDPVE